MEKSFQELDLSNAFLFAAALEDSETCRLVLEIVLGGKVPPVNVHSEHSILVSSDFRSVRLDIYAKDELEVNYNVESQNKNEGNLPKRSRYYQAEMDVSSLKPGEDFDELKPSYIIFICAFDPFGRKLYRYTFEERCLERDFPLGDETKKIFLSTKGQNRDEVPQELIHFLEYMEESTDEYVATVEEEAINKLHARVTELKKQREMEARYMTVEELLKSREKEGRAEGKAEGLVEGRIEGLIEGRTEAILELLEETGTVPEALRKKILAEKDLELLKKWNRLAAKAATIVEFTENM